MKVGHKNKQFKFKVSKDLKKEEIDKIVRYLVAIKEIEKTYTVSSINTIDTEKIEQPPSVKPVDVDET